MKYETNLFTFSGKIGRKNYAINYGILVITFLLFSFIFSPILSFAKDYPTLDVLCSTLYFGALIAFVVVSELNTLKRVRDIFEERSNRILAMIFAHVPIINLFILAFLFFWPGVETQVSSLFNDQRA